MSPVDYSHYPDDWHEISQRIREQAGNQCEFCNAPNGVYILRHCYNPEIYVVCVDEANQLYKYGPERRQIADLPSAFSQSKPIKVVLTVAHHPDPDPMNVSDENLHALCQRCHNRLDAPMRAKHAKKTRARKKEQALRDAGQERLL